MHRVIVEAALGALPIVRDLPGLAVDLLLNRRGQDGYTSTTDPGKPPVMAALHHYGRQA